MRNNKKLKMSVLVVLLMAAIAVLAMGCVMGGGDDTTSDISKLEILNPDDAVFTIGEVDLSDIEILITKTNGTTEQKRLTDTMLSSGDLAKLRKEGTYSVAITYSGKSVVLQIKIVPKSVLQTYDVYFDSDGGTDVSPMLGVTEVTAFTNPTKDGFAFAGWFLNANCDGDRVTAPYVLTEETTFYAKWEDNRKYTVRFLDSKGNAISTISPWTQTVVHGADVAFVPENGPPSDLTPEGQEFVRWKGQLVGIESNVDITPEYKVIQLTVTYYQNYKEDSQQAFVSKINYGAPLPENARYNILPREGHEAEWMVENADGTQVPLLETHLEKITADLKIVSKYTIFTYNILFYDDDAYVGSPDYWSKSPIVVNYNQSIDFTSQAYLSLSSPDKRRGTDAQWSVQTSLVPRATERCIRSFKDGYIWDSAISEWTYDISASEFNVYDETTGDVIAVISEKQIREIKGNLVITARYQKNKYNLEFNYSNGIVGGGEKSMTHTMQNVKYGSKIALYDVPDEEKIDGVIYDYALEKTKFLYYPSILDWSIVWHIGSSEGDLIDFDDTYFTVDDENHKFSAEKQDLREFRVRFFDWDFETGKPVPLKVVVDGVSTSEQMVASNGRAVFPLAGAISSKLSYGYEFVHQTNYWYDAPYNAGFGVSYDNTMTVTADIDLYVRYKLREYNIYISDGLVPVTNENLAAFNLLSPQPTYIFVTDSEAYGVIKYAQMYSVFKRTHGYQFNIDEIYFGGDEIYNNVKLIESYEADAARYAEFASSNPGGVSAKEYVRQNYLDIYNFIITDYNTLPLEASEDNWPTNLTGDATVIDILKYALVKIGDMNNLVAGNTERGLMQFMNPSSMNSFPQRRYTYNYTEHEKALFERLSEDGNALYSELRALHTEINALYSFSIEYMAARKYKYDAIKANKTLYAMLKYSLSQRNSYEFSGLFVNSTFSSNSKVNINQEGYLESEVAAFNGGIKNNSVLYAQWIDTNIGSYGLVFEPVLKLNPNYDPGNEDSEEYVIDYYKIIDYVNNENRGEKYTFDSGTGNNARYSYVDKNGNTVGGISINPMRDFEEAMDSSVQIPSSHNGIPVKYIADTIFADMQTCVNGIKGIFIPFSIETIEEGSFFGLKGFGSEPIEIDESNPNYAVMDKVIYGIDSTGENPVYKTVLSYPSNLVRTAPMQYYGYAVPDSVYVVPATVTRIAALAFSAISADIGLTDIAFALSDDTLVIGEMAFANSESILKIGGLQVVDSVLSANTTLPDRVVKIGAMTFSGLTALSEITLSENSKLKYVGEKIFDGTKWLRDKGDNQIITWGHVIVGVKGTLNQYTNSEVKIGGNSADYPQITVVADRAFYNCTPITSLTIGADVKYIGKNAFSGTMLSVVFATALSSPNSCELGEGAFLQISTAEIFVSYAAYDQFVSTENGDNNGWRPYITLISQA